MGTFLMVGLLYLGVGVLMNFVGPIAHLIRVEKMKLALKQDVPTLKRVGFILVLRLGVALIYPLFLFG